MGSEHATGSPLKAYGSESERGWGFEIPGPCIQLASIRKARSQKSGDRRQNLLDSDSCLLRKGAVAQLGERLICTQEAAGSIPTSSTSVGTAVRTAGPVAQMARAHP